MTPEQRAALPTYPVVVLPDPEHVAAVDRMLASVREMLHERRDREYPMGHPERQERKDHTP